MLSAAGSQTTGGAPGGSGSAARVAGLVFDARAPVVRVGASVTQEIAPELNAVDVLEPLRVVFVPGLGAAQDALNVVLVPHPRHEDGLRVERGRAEIAGVPV